MLELCYIFWAQTFTFATTGSLLLYGNDTFTVSSEPSPALWYLKTN